MINLKGLNKHDRKQAKDKHSVIKQIKDKSISENITKYFEREFLLDIQKDNLNSLELEVFFLGIKDFNIE